MRIQQVIDNRRKVAPNKLMFKKKDKIDGSLRLKVRNVTLGFMMVPGVDFTERFSPVAAEASFKTQLLINIKKYKHCYRTHSCCVEVSFLDPTMDNVTFVELHP